VIRLAYLPACLILMSALEYIAHRWLMHRRFAPLHWFLPHIHRDHIHHHGGAPDALHVNLEPPYVIVTLAAVSPLLALMGWYDPWLMVVMMLTVAAHHAVWDAVHREIHEPTYPWWRESRAFLFWHRWHERHHANNRRNYAALLPFWDYLLGTAYRGEVA
jgi:sterol desaturase/sphingolipid hydroxylase (fatty acid hydroxylase superfamily)